MEDTANLEHLRELAKSRKLALVHEIDHLVMFHNEDFVDGQVSGHARNDIDNAVAGIEFCTEQGSIRDLDTGCGRQGVTSVCDDLLSIAGPGRRKLGEFV